MGCEMQAVGSPLLGVPLALVGEGWAQDRVGAPATGARGSAPWWCSSSPHPAVRGPAHLSDLLEPVWLHVGKDVALGLGENLKGHCAVVVLQGRDVIVSDGQLRAGVDLVPGMEGESTRNLGHLRGRSGASRCREGIVAPPAVPGTRSSGLS